MGALSQHKIKKLFAEGDAAATPHEKGAKLEEIIRYTISSIPGVEHFKSNVVNLAQSEEVDVAFYNNKERRGCPFLEHCILTECKNWSAPVGAAHVREFEAKLERRACANGLLVAANGITGNAIDKTHAHDAVRMALAMKSIRILVVTRSEIEAWAHSDDIVRLLKLKLCESVVDGSIFL